MCLTRIILKSFFIICYPTPLSPRRADRFLLETRYQNGLLNVRVSDHGIGISQEDQKYIFEHFFRGQSCLMTTFLAIAENSKLEFTAFFCASKGKLEHINGKFLMTKVILEPEVTIRQEEDRERTLRILQKTEAACLISNSIKSTIVMLPTITVKG